MEDSLKTNYHINWFFPLFMVFAQYSIIGSYSLGIIFLLFFVVLYFFVYKSIAINKWILFFILMCIFFQVFVHRSTFGVLTFVISLIALAVFSDKINENQLLKYFKIFGTIAILGIVYQSVTTYVFHMPVSPIKIFPLDSEAANLNWAENILRPSSFFAEPQAFATYMMPFLFLTLKHRKFAWAAFITFSVLLSTSSQGLIMMTILWSGYLVFTELHIRLKLVILLVFTIFVVSYLTLPLFEISRLKLFQTEILGNPRLSRGFEIFFHLTEKEKIIGIGYGNVGNYVYNIRDSFLWSIGNTPEKLNYTSGFSGLMVQFGLIATIIFVFVIYKIWKESYRENRPFLIMIFAASFSQNLLLNTWFIYLFLFYLGINYKPGNSNKRLRLKF